MSSSVGRAAERHCSEICRYLGLRQKKNKITLRIDFWDLVRSWENLEIMSFEVSRAQRGS